MTTTAGADRDFGSARYPLIGLPSYRLKLTVVPILLTPILCACAAIVNQARRVIAIRNRAVAWRSFRISTVNVLSGFAVFVFRCVSMAARWPERRQTLPLRTNIRDNVNEATKSQ